MLISKSSNNRNYVDNLMNQYFKEELNRREAAWIRYLQDHRDLLVKNSEWVPISRETMNVYKYRPRKFLASQNRSDELELAFMITNRFYTYMDFNFEVEGVYIPDNRYVSELRQMYLTIARQLAKL